MKKLKNPNVYSYECSIYPETLDILFEQDCVDYINHTYLWQKDPEATFQADDYTGSFGVTYDLLYNRANGKRTVLVMFDGIPNIPQMVHEAFHAMNGIFKDVNLEFNFSDSASNEHLAYLIQWIVSCMCDAMEKEKKCRKKKK